MILNFLQTREPPILPSLHMLPHKKKPPNNGVDVSFADDIDALRGWGKDNHETLGELLFAFFKKYGHDMDYETRVLSVRAGKLLSKAEKGWQYLQNNRLCVEEPFSTGRNLGNTADDCSMRGIHLEFRRAHKILAERADLAECCQLFEFPREEVHHVPPPQAPSRPVTLSRSNSNHSRGGGGYRSGNQRGGGGRGYQYNNRNHNPNPNRNNQNGRGSSGAAAFNQNVMQNHYVGHSPEMFSYLPSAHDQLVALQAQIQAHAHAQAQLIAQAHAQSQLHNQHSSASQSTPSMQANGSANALDGISPFLSWTYLAHLYGINMLYPGYVINQSNANSDASNGPTSPPHTPAGMVDGRQDRGNGNGGNRLGLGRGGGRPYGAGSRSQSQPPPLYSANGCGRNMSAVTAVSSEEDEDFGDHSSNGNPPETPPEEGPDEYVGYYSIGGSLQPDLAIVDPHIGEEEEPFLEHKTAAAAVDRQKRFSHEKLPPMLGQSRGTSPIPSKAPASDRHLHMVNGNTLQPPPYVRDTIFPFESGGLNGIDGASDPTVRNGIRDTLEQRERPLAKLHEVHNGQAVRANDVVPSPPHASSGQLRNAAAQPATSPTPVPPSTGSSSECESESAGSPASTPNLRQPAATSQQLLWTNSRTPFDSLNGSKGHGSQEDFALPPPLTPVLEVPSPPPTSTRKPSSPKPATEAPVPAAAAPAAAPAAASPAAPAAAPVPAPAPAQAKKRPERPVATRKNISKDDPTPPTPAPTPAEKNGQRNGHGRSKINGVKSSPPSQPKNTKKEATEPKSDKKPAESKQQWKKIKKGRSQANIKEATAPKELERKGG
jgi:hypothetical protein